ncbi:MAG: DNA mismatch repair endonuclease MutL, partial [FCB group bacterium]|nr:DNA mismatch repair endonuclease MutL [FCB group bacterium]
MTCRIRVLSDNVISQIAAGEVIEGPHAVLKELVENSLDAGASSITIALEKGGKSLIKVSDDGEGMSGEELQIAFHRHSTSKIFSAEELVNITSLGFRGEALASIASVARVSAVSQMKDAAEGYSLVIEGGIQKDFVPAGAAPGTMIAVKDLFYNVPARKKFLKSDQRELDKCLNIFRALALSRPEIEWTVFVEDKLKFKYAPADLSQRIGDIFGREMREGLIEVNLTNGPYKITGFAADKSHTRKTRQYQFIFLNNRRIIDRRLGFFIQQAYERIAGRDSFPCYFLYLEMESSLVDVNVHPAKLEVRFRQEWEAGNFVKRAVHKALGVDSFIPQTDIQPRGYFSQPHSAQRLSMNPSVQAQLYQSPVELGQSQQTDKSESEQQSSDNGSEAYYIPDILFQLHDKYIVTQVRDGLIMIDQHAAHERILYETALKALTSGSAVTQKQLFPRLIEFTPMEDQLFEQLLPCLNNMGFGIKPFGPHTYLIESIPGGGKISVEGGLARGMR